MSSVFSGSKGSLKLNGVKVAYVGSVSINQENTLTDIDVLDQLSTAELAPTGHKVSFTCNLFKIDDNSAEALGLETSNLDDLLSMPSMTMEIYDRIEDKVRYTIQGVSWEGGSGSMDARGVWTGTWNFKGLIGGRGAGSGSL